MKRWQIQTRMGGCVEIIEAITPIEALNKYAMMRGGTNWKEWNAYLGLSAEYEVKDNFRIITA